MFKTKPESRNSFQINATLYLKQSHHANMFIECFLHHPYNVSKQLRTKPDWPLFIKIKEKHSKRASVCLRSLSHIMRHTHKHILENYFVVVLNLRLRTYFCCCESLPDFSRRIALISFRELQLSLLFPCASLSIALFHLLRILTTPTSESSNNTQSCLDFRLRLFYYVLPISRIKFFTSHKTVTLAMRSTHTNFPLF